MYIPVRCVDCRPLKKSGLHQDRQASDPSALEPTSSHPLSCANIKIVYLELLVDCVEGINLRKLSSWKALLTTAHRTMIRQVHLQYALATLIVIVARKSMRNDDGH